MTRQEQFLAELRALMEKWDVGLVENYEGDPTYLVSRHMTHNPEDKIEVGLHEVPQ